MRALFCFVGLLGMLASSLTAHEDPSGEVHPKIEVKDDEFIVNAIDNTRRRKGEDRVVTRRVDRNGTVLETRAGFLPTPPFKNYSFTGELPEEQNGIERETRDGWLIFPDFHRKHGGNPYLIRMRGKTASYFPLHWKRADVREVRDAIVDGDNLYLLVTRVTGTDGVELWLHRFSLASYHEEAALRLPDPCVIYAFPVCSNLVLYKDTVYLAIVTKRLWGYDLLLAGWDGASKSCEKQSLTNEVDWNTHVVMSHISGDALIAYHYPGDYGAGWPFFSPKPSKIRTVHVKLKGAKAR